MKADQPIVEAIAAERAFGQSAKRVEALKPATLALRRGDFAVLYGRSGSGKTTLLNLLGLLDRPSSGRICFKGRDTAMAGDRKRALMRRGALGYVLQDSGVIERMSVLDNVRLPGLYAGLGRKRAGKLALEALADLDLADKAGRMVGALSGGERMRVGLARALCLSPDLVICDEPTASLDAATSQIVIQRLSHAAAQGRCVVAASHDPDVIRQAERVITLEHGRIVSDQSTKGVS